MQTRISKGDDLFERSVKRVLPLSLFFRTRCPHTLKYIQITEMDPSCFSIKAVETKSHLFQQILASLKQTVNYLDQPFLLKLIQAVQLKAYLSNQEVSQIAILLLLAADQASRSSSSQSTSITAQKVQKIEQLLKLINPSRSQKSFRKSQNSLGRLIHKIWRKLLHYSCQKNYLDIACLFYCIGQTFQNKAEQLQKVTSLLFQSASKIKVFPPESLQAVLFLIQCFLKDFQNTNKSLGLKIKLKMLRILFLSKIKDPNEDYKSLIKNVLKQFIHLELKQSTQLMKLCGEPEILKSEELVWQKLFYTILTYYFRKPQFQLIAKQFLKEMISFKIDIQAVKLMIKELQITNEVDPVQKWQQIFELMSFALSIYPNTKQTALFKSNLSFLKIYLNEKSNFTLELVVNCLSKSFDQERFLFIIKGKDKKEEVWVTSRCQGHNQMRLILLKVFNKNILYKCQKVVHWRPQRQNTFVISFDSKEIKVNVNKIAQNSIQMRRCIENVDSLVVGDEYSLLGTYITQLLSLKIYSQASQQKNFEKTQKLDLNSKNIQLKQIMKKTLDSFIDIIKAAGDLDIFLLIVSHAFKKMKRDHRVLDMVKHPLSLMEHFVEAKRVKTIKLTPQQRQQRSNAILCLCWQGSQSKNNGMAVIELLRVLRLRGRQNYQDELQVLCNFVFWKEFDWQYQRMITQKIKEIFLQARRFEVYWKKLHEYCERILLEAVIFYGQEDPFNCPQQQSQLLKIYRDFFDLVQEQFQFQIQNLRQMKLIESSLQFLLKLLCLTFSKKYGNFAFSYSKIKINTYDIAFSVLLSQMLRKLCQKIKIWNSKEELLLKLIANGLQLCQLHKEEQKQFEQRAFNNYQRQNGLMQPNLTVIKQNIHFAVEHLVSLKEGMLQKMIRQEQPGIGQIVSIAWQKQFFQPMISYQNQNQLAFEDNIENLRKLAAVRDKFPLKYLSVQQNKILLRIYLRNNAMYPQIDFKIHSHFWSIIGIKETLQTVKLELLQNKKSISQPDTSSRVIQEKENVVKIDVELFEKKILSLLVGCDKLVSHEALVIIKIIEFLFNQRKTKCFALVKYHFLIKNLVENIEGLGRNPSSNSSQQSELRAQELKTEEGESLMNRLEFIKCIDFYHSKVKINDIMMIRGIQKNEEANNYHRDFKTALQEMLKILHKLQPQIISELRPYYNFIRDHLLKFSKYYLQATGMSPVFQGILFPRREARYVFQLPKVYLRQESQNMYHRFVQQRKLALINVKQIWSKVEQRNKYFWNIFLGNQMEYVLYEATGPLNEKYLLKKSTKKAKLQLPRMIQRSMCRNTSMASGWNQHNQEAPSAGNSMFENAFQYSKGVKNGFFPSKIEAESTKQYKPNMFPVLLITTSKIYQGKLSLVGKKLIFKEAENIDQQIYAKISASEAERRTVEECVSENYRFQEEMNSKCVTITKRYLFHDQAMQIQTKNRSFLFGFIKKGNRQIFLSALQKQKVIVINRAKIFQQLKKVMQMWQRGEITNFRYLMKVNNLVGRSFNDLSQYYIFPWSVVNHSTPSLDRSFFQNRQNFRDLSLPMGKINKSKWQNIKKNFQKTALNQIDLFEPFLFGSFYSNPAIVSNFMIRVNPFASQHFQLQSHEFDLADRLFYSIQESFKTLTHCSSDNKQLIPQFYYFPQFLKNRNRYNLGSRQNQDIVNNVILPRWASDEYQYVFKMRKILQSQEITKNLHRWIDLIFGVYAKKKEALKADNLFLANLYIETYQQNVSDKNKQANMYIKQFGQVPVPILNAKHPPSKYNQNFLDLIVHQSMKHQEILLQKPSQTGKLLQIYFAKRYTFLLFEKELRMYLDEQYGEKQYISTNGEFSGGSILFWQTFQKEKKKQLLIIHRKSSFQLLGFQIKRNLFYKYSLEGESIIQFKHKVQLLAIYDPFIICTQAKIIYIYKKVEDAQQEYSSNPFSTSIYIAKNKYSLNSVSQFTQHSAKILYIGVTQRGILVSMDEENKLLISQIGGSSIEVFNYFAIKSIYFQEKVVQILLHNLGFIVLRTDYDRLMMFSFLGDKIIDKMIRFKKLNVQSEQQESISTMSFWNEDFCELLIMTTSGNVWKIDPFSLKRQEQVEQVEIWIEKISLSKAPKDKNDCKLAVNRIGRYCSVLLSTQQSKLYSISSQKWDQIKRANIERTRAEDYW